MTRQPKKGFTNMPNDNLWGKLLFSPTILNKTKLASSVQAKTIVITGASSGIGEQLAYLLADYPVHLILVARRGEKLQQMKREIEKKSARVSCYQADLRDAKEREGFLAFLHQQPAGVDIVVNNAGHSIRRSIQDSLDRYHDFTRTMAINYFAPVQLLLSLIPQLQRNQGKVINISTINTSLIPLPYWAAYQASKSAFDTWFRSAAPELNAIGIATTSIYLPLVKTPMILPTKAYQNMPAMSAQHAAQWIAKTMYTKRKTIMPWWLIFGQLASIFGRRFWEWAIPRWLRKRRG
ncbi:SDR family NAD(P)-dependent oxidoreductase [Brevibacillus ruminantium]|uniref:SDR family NAD(P)-dependent oxidoreductase n=1 Tax=Brevibacillus ruminantium TaxID=2950604 RepID=A0ABY4WEH8_9BACL|nr:SDR family NAD(P)-dependent oxidoreductase [Brevibacillus ruminantium]USG64367.1 SDR family NAD(P)-dependent oxidoreductase [Brevibacillus ruminantium]